MRIPSSILSFLTILFVVSSCVSKGGISSDDVSAKFFSIGQTADGAVLKTVSPFDGSVDSLVIDSPMTSIVCMSSTYVAAFAEVGATEAVSGVSGKKYISNAQIKENPSVIDVGFDGAMDYEAIVALSPDLVLAYAVSAVEPSYVSKLNSLGVRTLVLYDNFEQHPLARAEYIKVAGALTGRSAQADSVFTSVADSYMSMAGKECGAKVLLNVPYGDAWYVPGKDSYVYRLIADAGGEIMGSRDGMMSTTISVEEAYSYASQADFWLNPGFATSLGELKSLHSSFDAFLRPDLKVYNNTLRMNSEGGNDFYERGAMRPDLILADLCAVFSGSDRELEYYLEVK